MVVKREITGAAPLLTVNGMIRELSSNQAWRLGITVVTERWMSVVSEAAESSKGIIIPLQDLLGLLLHCLDHHNH